MKKPIHFPQPDTNSTNYEKTFSYFAFKHLLVKQGERTTSVRFQSILSSGTTATTNTSSTVDSSTALYGSFWNGAFFMFSLVVVLL